jgi:uncharacterized protein YidB (DUF937 family)
MSTAAEPQPAAPEAGSTMFQYVFEMVQGNGLKSLVEKFHAQGLGEVVSSWIGTGENHPITVDQLRNVLSPEHISELAGKLGLSQEKVLAQLSTVLPGLVDKLTPNGELPKEGMVEQGVEMLKGVLTGFLGRSHSAETAPEEEAGS